MIQGVDVTCSRRGEYCRAQRADILILKISLDIVADFFDRTCSEGLLVDDLAADFSPLVQGGNHLVSSRCVYIFALIT
jgi:hypothetical protein